MMIKFVLMRRGPPVVEMLQVSPSRISKIEVAIQPIDQPRTSLPMSLLHPQVRTKALVL